MTTNTYLSKSVSTLGSRRKWGYSLWVKRSGTVEDTQSILMGYEDGNNYTKCQFNGTDYIEFSNVYGGSTTGQKITDAKYKDVNAWYHIYLIWNTLDPATADDRMQIWVNGSRITEFSSSSNPGATTESAWNANPTTHYIGANDAGSNHLWNGYMAQICSTDGTAPAVTAFGSTDATTGEWKPKSDGEIRDGVTFGTNGFLLTFENASQLGYDYQTSDRSGSTFDYTKNGDGFKSQTNPSNIFATAETRYKYVSNFSWYTGNTKFINTGSWAAAFWNMAPTTGKWYFEAKLITIGSGAMFGIASVDEIAQVYNTGFNVGEGTYQYAYNANGNKKSADSETAFGNTYTSGDIMGCAFDLDNGKIYFAKNGTWENSGDPTSGSTGTGAAYSVTTGGGYPYTPSLATYGSGHWAVNTGEGWFGGTQVSSANADGAGQGQMEYTVPTGYYTMCTKNLKTYG
jgi:hypothetical protein